MPSFSSTLLDEICRSIDKNIQKTEGCRSFSGKARIGFGEKKSLNDEDIVNFRKSCLVDKWMKEHQVVHRTKSSQNDELLVFNSSSSSSDSSSQISSSYDKEFFGDFLKPPHVSCFTANPKPVRTSVAGKEQNSCNLFDESGNQDSIIKNKSKALKIYANIKKMKQPISPGMKLTSFINSLFNNQKLKPVESKSALKCSSASSFSRGSLSNSPLTDKMTRDDDSKIRGKKYMSDEDSGRCKRPPLPPNALADLKLGRKEKRNIIIEETPEKVFRGDKLQTAEHIFVSQKVNENQDEDEDNEDDAMSDSSSDLFELDHLSLFGNNSFCDELPVYETTNVRSVAGSYIC